MKTKILLFSFIGILFSSLQPLHAEKPMTRFFIFDTEGPVFEVLVKNEEVVLEDLPLKESLQNDCSDAQNPFFAHHPIDIKPFVKPEKEVPDTALDTRAIFLQIMSNRLDAK